MHQYSMSMDIAEHYKSELKMKYLEIRYEDLVAEQEAKTREMLSFVNLAWDDKCLEFYKNKRVVSTASYDQVTKQMYTTARYRYKSYFQQLEPLEHILHDTIIKLGYSFEA